MRIVLRILGFLKPYTARVVFANICLVASTAFGMLVPWMVGEALDIIEEAIDTGLYEGVQEFLLFAAIVIVAASAFRGAFSFGQSYLVEYISQRVAYDLRNAIFDHLQRLSFSYHDNARTGQLMSRATADVEGVRAFISFGIMRILYLVVLFFAVATVLLFLNWRLALVSFAVLPIVAYRAIIVSRRLRTIWIRIQQELANLGTVLQEALSGVRVVKFFAQERQESKKFAAKADDIYQLNMAANKEQAYNTPFMSFVLTVSTGIILWYGGRQVIEGQLTLGGLVVFNSFLFMLAMPVRTLGWMVNLYSRATSSGQRIFEILDAQSDVKDKPGARSLAAVQGLVSFEAVSFSYDSVAPVLKNIDLEAKPGQVVALLGATGSGKSTITNLIPRFYDVTSGRITIDGTDIRDVTLKSLRRHVGIVLQDPFLFSATIRDNLAYGKADASMEDIIWAAQTARIHDFIDGLPDGYDTWVGERGITLSGGQRQRVAIARTLLTDPRILILDDATSSVDTETEYLIQQALAELMVGRTTFVIAQRLKTVKEAEQILVLKEGEIVERGRHEELLEQGGIYKEIYDLQLKDQEAVASQKESSTLEEAKAG